MQLHFHSCFPGLCLLAALAGCGAATPASVEPGPSPADEAELEALRERASEQQQRMRELEGRLALAQAEARDVREELASRERAAPRETVRIGEERQPVDPHLPPWEEASSDDADDAPRPVLRLYGQRRTEERTEPAPPLVLPPAPAGMPDRLPVAPLPGERRAAEPEDLGRVELPRAAPTEPAADPAEALYREALARVRDREFERAGRALNALLEEHSGHGRAVDARYWRGVVRYAGRRYEQALADFRWVVEHHSGSERAPDALFKMALCHQRMGDVHRARALFRSVRSRYPDSVAARMASQQEDAS